MCIALGELHPWETLLLPASEVPAAGKPQPTQRGVWVTQPGTVICHTPWKHTPKPPSTRWGQQTASPPQFRWPFKRIRVKRHIGDSPARDQDSPKTTHSHHIGAAPDGHCSGSTTTSQGLPWESLCVTEFQGGLPQPCDIVMPH